MHVIWLQNMTYAVFVFTGAAILDKHTTAVLSFLSLFHISDGGIELDPYNYNVWTHKPTF